MPNLWGVSLVGRGNGDRLYATQAISKTRQSLARSWDSVLRAGWCDGDRGAEGRGAARRGSIGHRTAGRGAVRLQGS